MCPCFLLSSASNSPTPSSIFNSLARPPVRAKKRHQEINIRLRHGWLIKGPRLRASRHIRTDVGHPTGKRRQTTLEEEDRSTRPPTWHHYSSLAQHGLIGVTSELDQADEMSLFGALGYGSSDIHSYWCVQWMQILSVVSSCNFFSECQNNYFYPHILATIIVVWAERWFNRTVITLDGKVNTKLGGLKIPNYSQLHSVSISLLFSSFWLNCVIDDMLLVYLHKNTWEILNMDEVPSPFLKIMESWTLHFVINRRKWT